MAQKPILIAQISDLHIKAPDSLAYGKVDTARALERCVATLNALAPRPDLVVISGDLADTPTEEEYAHLTRLLAPLQIPLVAIPGNHDSRDLMRTAFAQPLFPAEGALNQVQPVGDVDVVLLDSSVHGQPHGELDDDTLQWLDAVLSSSDRRPALLFLHHPPFRTGIWHMDRQNLRNASAFATIVERYPWVKLVAAGHVHRATLTQFAGVPATICPAPNHAVALDLGELLEPSFRIEPPAFHLHAWFADDSFGDLVTHQVPIGAYDGPHPFFGSDGKLL
ncbi:phosphodiesterase [Rhodopseudomonas palustris]|uniref:phosphodiesterase n=1 Tax=Rhodopseudomonas palustris TaxID=1076 RepID=UPI002ACEF85A|nr:phosphodiesterase [Rhodopseudomonas palustris]WQG97727.1 phosphodiesterase [Rhodopseudomonas palustris]